MKSTSEILLQESQRMLAPLAQALIQQGVTYPQFAATMKLVFLEVARQELRARDQRETDSAVSVLSGVHRKEVRSLGKTTSAEMSPALTLASQIFTRWMTDPTYRDGNNKPSELPRNGGENSFDALAISVSKDVHPRTALEELLRLGMVTVEADRVRLKARAFVPKQGFKETVALFSHSVADHIACGAHNLTSRDADKFLEQSIFASGLTDESAKHLGDFARELWSEVFEKMVPEAEVLVKRDKNKVQAKQRMRLGVYFYADTSDAMEVKSIPKTNSS